LGPALSTIDRDGWHRTSPLAAIFYLGKIYQAIAQHALPSLAPLAVFLFAAEGNLGIKIAFGVGAFVIVTVTGAVIRYLFFRYRITDDSILVREGVFNKTQLDIKFDRIQAINTQQNIVYRAFDLVTVKFDTAGSSKQEGHLPAVRIALADALKDRIRQESAAKAPANDSTEITDTEEIVGSNENTLLQLDVRDMVRIGLSSNRALLFLVFLSPLMQRFENEIEEKVVEGDAVEALASVDVVAAAQTGLAEGVGLGALIVIGLFLFLVAASIIGAFLRFHRFKLVKANEVLRSTSGLLTHHEHSINLAKIQTVLATQNIMLMLFRRFRLNANQASSSKQAKSKSFTIPLCDSGQLPILATEMFGDEFPGVVLDPTSSEFVPIAIDYVRSRVILAGILPASVVTAIMFVPMGWYALIFLLWIPLIGAVVWRLYKRYGISVTKDGIARRRGFIGFRISAFLHRKVQRISITQTALQRRVGLASLRFYLASGSIKVPYVDFRKATAIRDYVLYTVESSQKAWH
jgi:putative membrane protein